MYAGRLAYHHPYDESDVSSLLGPEPTAAREWIFGSEKVNLSHSHDYAGYPR